MQKKMFSLSRREFLALSAVAVQAAAPPRQVFVVPNFHPASCGWLTNFSKERVYCANSYFDHLDRVRDDAQYAFVLSEVNNIIAMLNFQPKRAEELRTRIREGRVELVNAFFLESTINISGGEALVRLGVEGLRWQREMFGVRPRIGWTIDVCGTHDQMAQICAGLGLEAMVYTRKNPTGSALHWAESPDGSTILAISPGHYSEFRQVMSAKEPLPVKTLEEVRKYLDSKHKITPSGAPILLLAGGGDYALAPPLKRYPGEFLEKWKSFDPSHEIRFTTMSRYLDAVQPPLKSGQLKIPTLRGGTAYDFNSFWIQNPKVKSWFRKDEHLLQAAEMLATAASLRGGYRYPAQELYHAWLQMFLSMDRNTLWGSAGGMVFEHERSWDAADRLTWVEKHSSGILTAAGNTLSGSGSRTALFNPLAWKRNDPFLFDGTPIQAELPASGVVPLDRPRDSGAASALPASIETRHYSARIDPRSGALTSLKLKPSGRELLSGAANVLVAEKPKSQNGDPGDHMLPRPERVRVASTSDTESKVTFIDGPLAKVVEVTGAWFQGAKVRRLIRFWTSHPRIDFETELNDIPDRTVIVSEFPLAEAIQEVRRGIPYGFSHGAWEKRDPNLHGWTEGIVPAVRWSHYALAGGGGVAILDRGLTGRELNGRTPIIYLYNATDKYYGYPNAWLSGKGRHLLEYALVAHAEPWEKARIPHMAWEYNCPPVVIQQCAARAAGPIVETSGNVIVEALRREAGDIELRLAECLGLAGEAEVTLHLPHRNAALTNLLGAEPKPLSGGPRYRFPVRAQQIVTLRFRAASSAGDVKPLTEWDPLVPEHKRAALREYSSDKGHPPRGE